MQKPKASLSGLAAAAADNAQIVSVCGLWVFCSVGMMVFNKLAVTALPLECTLTVLQMLVTVVTIIVCCWDSLHVGSFRDLLRWARVAPLFAGVLLTSMLALKNSPMSLVIVFRGLSPLFGMAVESFYPTPLKVSPMLVLSLLLMVLGVGLYAKDMEFSSTNLFGIGCVLLNNLFIIGDRLLQRLMLAKDQSPVDISTASCTMLLNALAVIPIAAVALWTREFHEVPAAVAKLDTAGATFVAISCIVGVGIAYVGVWAQSLISATSFLVMATGNKFLVVLIEVFIMQSKRLTPSQVIGATTTILSGVLYGKVREALDNHLRQAQSDSSETEPLVETEKKV